MAHSYSRSGEPLGSDSYTISHTYCSAQVRLPKELEDDPSDKAVRLPNIELYRY